MRVSIGSPGSTYAKVYLNGLLQNFVQLADTNAGYICQYVYEPDSEGHPIVFDKITGKDAPHKAIHRKGLVQIVFESPDDPGLSSIIQDYYKNKPPINEDYITPYGDLVCYGCNEIIDRTLP